MNITDLAYSAGAIDADGNITIKRSLQRVRNAGDCARACYSPRISLGQVTEQVPEFLRGLLGGSIYITKPGTRNSRPLFKWYVSDKRAGEVAAALMPLLKIKSEQAGAVVDLQRLRSSRPHATYAAWFERENPNWRTTSNLLTTDEVMSRLGYSRPDMVTQAIKNGTLLAAHRGAHGGKAIPRIPSALVEQIAKARRTTGQGSRTRTAPPMVEAQHELYERVRLLNRVGVSGTCVNHRTGKHAQLA